MQTTVPKMPQLHIMKTTWITMMLRRNQTSPAKMQGTLLGRPAASSLLPCHSFFGEFHQTSLTRVSQPFYCLVVYLADRVLSAIPLATDPQNGDAVTLKGFCTSAISNHNDRTECFSFEELSEVQSVRGVKALLRGYGAVHSVHITGRKTHTSGYKDNRSPLILYCAAGSVLVALSIAMAFMAFTWKKSGTMNW